MLERDAEREREREAFARVMLLNASAKELIARSLRVNLLALDAMVQSKRGGTSLKGFDEVSSQMRSWSRDLHRDLERLGALSRRVLLQASVDCKERHLLRLLGRAAAESPRLAADVYRRREAEQHERDGELQRTWRQIADAVSDLNQLGLMAVVLARSAMIEASSGSPEQRAQLSDVTREFCRNSEAVASVLKELGRATQRS